MEKTLSVIIPTYNMRDYLAKCVASIVAAKNADAVEILIVNDGSTDGTLALADALAAEYAGIVRVIDKPNGGHGSAINIGSRECAGRYFCVVDADDWVDSEQFAALVDGLNECSADCVVCDYVMVYEASGTEITVDMTSGCDKGVPIPFERYIKGRDLQLHAVTYKTEMYRAAGITLSEKCYFDDMQYCAYAYAAIKDVVCLSANAYRYRLEREGQSVSPTGFMKHIDDHRRVIDEMCVFFGGFSGDEGIKDALAAKIANHIAQRYGFIAKYGDKRQLAVAKQFDKKLKKAYPLLYKYVGRGKGARLLRFLHFGCMPVLKIFRKFVARG